VKRNWLRRGADGHRAVAVGHEVSGLVITGDRATVYQSHPQEARAVTTSTDSLPPVPAGFTGRQEDLKVLLRLLAPAVSGQEPSPEGRRPGGHESAAPGSAAVVVTSVAGMGGVGKTSLALAAARLAGERGWFDLLLFVDLRGYDPTPAAAGQAVDVLLRMLGVPTGDLPTTVEERVGLYRAQLSRLAEQGRRVLVLADNASKAEQVRLLIPNSSTHRLLITSRHTLTTLGARLVDLDVLPPDDAVSLLDLALVTADPSDTRITDQPEAARRVATLCARLPLALQIAASRLIGDRDLDCATLATALTSVGSRLGELDDGERAVRSSFQLSYENLTAGQAEAFRLLAIMLGPDFGLPAAAALLGVEEPAAQAVLAALVRAHLLERGAAPGRWRFHDLVHAYAQEQLIAQWPAADEPWDLHCAAMTRLLDHYVAAAADAEGHLRARRDRPAPGTFTGAEQALAWLDAERANLIIAVMAGAFLRASAIAVRLSTTLAEYFERRRHLDDWIRVTTMARDSARRSGDRHGEATASNSLGFALFSNRRYAEAMAAHEQAIALFRQHDDPACEAAAWNNHGLALHAAGRTAAALGAHRRALVTARHFGDGYLEAQAWSNLGSVLSRTGRHEVALRAHHRALAIVQQVGSLHDEASAWCHLGLTLSHSGRREEAVAAHRQDLAISEELGDELGQAMARGNLGIALRDLHRYDEAIAAHERAIRVFQALGASFDEAKGWVNLALDLRACGRDPAELSHAWTTAADCYAAAGAAREADQCRRLAEDPYPPGGERAPASRPSREPERSGHAALPLLSPTGPAAAALR